LIVVPTTRRSAALPKTVAILAGLGAAVGLAVAAPVHAASPSTAASRIVESRHHGKKPGREHARHHTSRPERGSSR
jgi:hypothetical protein